MAMIFQEKNGNDESQKKHSSALDRRKEKEIEIKIEKEIRALCRHHRDVLQ